MRFVMRLTLVLFAIFSACPAAAHDYADPDATIYVPHVWFLEVSICRHTIASAPVPGTTMIAAKGTDTCMKCEKDRQGYDVPRTCKHAERWAFAGGPYFSYSECGNATKEYQYTYMDDLGRATPHSFTTMSQSCRWATKTQATKIGSIRPNPIPLHKLIEAGY